MPGAIRVVQRNAVVYRHVWRGSVFSSFLQPTLYLLAIGLGVGGLIDRAGAGMLPAGVSFLEFLAPGLLAAACMQTATFESTWPIASKVQWQRTYEAILATPLGIRDLVLGELAWIAVRLSTVAIAFTLVMTAFGVGGGPSLLLAIPAAVLTGLAFSAPVMAYACALVKNPNSFNVLYRFIITPLFLFSGVFFPISRLPDALQAVAWLTPLFHGVELVRGLTLDTWTGPAALVHVAYLAGMLVAGAAGAIRAFEKRLLV